MLLCGGEPAALSLSGAAHLKTLMINDSPAWTWASGLPPNVKVCPSCSHWICASASEFAFVLRMGTFASPDSGVRTPV